MDCFNFSVGSDTIQTKKQINYYQNLVACGYDMQSKLRPEEPSQMGYFVVFLRKMLDALQKN